jgi:hypothetical protein
MIVWNSRLNAGSTNSGMALYLFPYSIKSISVPRAQISSSFPILDHEITHVPLPTLISSWPLVFAMSISPKNLKWCSLRHRLAKMPNPWVISCPSQSVHRFETRGGRTIQILLPLERIVGLDSEKAVIGGSVVRLVLRVLNISESVKVLQLLAPVVSISVKGVV